MDRSRKILASLGVLLGAVLVGAVAAAAVDGGTDGSAEESTTTSVAVPESSTTTSTTTEDTSTTEAPASTVPDSTPTTSTTSSLPDDPGTGDPMVGAEAYGLCNAFAGRAQPGNSQGWQRLQDAAGGDVDAYCAEVFAAKQAKRNSEPEVEEPEDETPEVTSGSAKPPAPKANKPASNGNRARNEAGGPKPGRGNGKNNR